MNKSQKTETRNRRKRTLRPNDLVSIVIPCFNQGQYLPETIASALAQEYEHTEIVLVDDGSTDVETQHIISKLRDRKIRAFRIKNSGLASARNFGIRKAKGKYILPLDADDKIHASYVKEAIELFQTRNDIGVVYAKAEFFDKKTGPWNLPPLSVPEILLDNQVYCSALFRRTDFLKVGGYNPTMKFGWEDWDLWLSFIERGLIFYQIPEVRFFYRVKESSMITSMSRERRILMYSQIITNHPKLFLTHLTSVVGDYLSLRDGYRRLSSMRLIRLAKFLKGWFR